MTKVCNCVILAAAEHDYRCGYMQTASTAVVDPDDSDTSTFPIAPFKILGNSVALQPHALAVPHKGAWGEMSTTLSPARRVRLLFMIRPKAIRDFVRQVLKRSRAFERLTSDKEHL